MPDVVLFALDKSDYLFECPRCLLKMYKRYRIAFAAGEPLAPKEFGKCQSSRCRFSFNPNTTGYVEAYQVFRDFKPCEEAIAAMHKYLDDDFLKCLATNLFTTLYRSHDRK